MLAAWTTAVAFLLAAKAGLQLASARATGYWWQAAFANGISGVPPGHFQADPDGRLNMGASLAVTTPWAQQEGAPVLNQDGSPTTFAAHWGHTLSSLAARPSSTHLRPALLSGDISQGGGKPSLMRVGTGPGNVRVDAVLGPPGTTDAARPSGLVGRWGYVHAGVDVDGNGIEEVLVCDPVASGCARMMPVPAAYLAAPFGDPGFVESPRPREQFLTCAATGEGAPSDLERLGGANASLTPTAVRTLVPIGDMNADGWDDYILSGSASEEPGGNAWIALAANGTVASELLSAAIPLQRVQREDELRHSVPPLSPAASLASQCSTSDGFVSLNSLGAGSLFGRAVAFLGMAGPAVVPGTNQLASELGAASSYAEATSVLVAVSAPNSTIAEGPGSEDPLSWGGVLVLRLAHLRSNVSLSDVKARPDQFGLVTACTALMPGLNGMPAPSHLLAPFSIRTALRLGESLAAHDLDGDGVVDLVLGAPVAGNGAGGVLFVFLRPSGRARFVTWVRRASGSFLLGMSVGLLAPSPERPNEISIAIGQPMGNAAGSIALVLLELPEAGAPAALSDVILSNQTAGEKATHSRTVPDSIGSPASEFVATSSHFAPAGRHEHAAWNCSEPPRLAPEDAMGNRAGDDAIALSPLRPGAANQTVFVASPALGHGSLLPIAVAVLESEEISAWGGASDSESDGQFDRWRQLQNSSWAYPGAADDEMLASSCSTMLRYVAAPVRPLALPSSPLCCLGQAGAAVTSERLLLLLRSPAKEFRPDATVAPTEVLFCPGGITPRPSSATQDSPIGAGAPVWRGGLQLSSLRAGKRGCVSALGARWAGKSIHTAKPNTADPQGSVEGESPFFVAQRRGLSLLARKAGTSELEKADLEAALTARATWQPYFPADEEGFSSAASVGLEVAPPPLHRLPFGPGRSGSAPSPHDSAAHATRGAWSVVVRFQTSQRTTAELGCDACVRVGLRPTLGLEQEAGAPRATSVVVNGAGGLPPSLLTAAPADYKAFGFSVQGGIDLDGDGIEDWVSSSRDQGGVGAAFFLFGCSAAAVRRGRMICGHLVLGGGIVHGEFNPTVYGDGQPFGCGAKAWIVTDVAKSPAACTQADDPEQFRRVLVAVGSCGGDNTWLIKVDIRRDRSELVVAEWTQVYAPQYSDTSEFKVQSLAANNAHTFGHNVELADLDLDGLPELIICDFRAASTAGAVFLVHFDWDAPRCTPERVNQSRTTTISSNDSVLAEAMPGLNSFGTSVFAAGDVSGDGIPDLVVGAYSMWGGVGACAIVHLNANGTAKAVHPFHSGGRIPATAQTRPSFKQLFCANVAGADTDGDGRVDVLAVGAEQRQAWQRSAADPKEADGVVFVYSLASDGAGVDSGVMLSGVDYRADKRHGLGKGVGMGRSADGRLLVVAGGIAMDGLHGGLQFMQIPGLDRLRPQPLKQNDTAGSGSPPLAMQILSASVNVTYRPVKGGPILAGGCMGAHGNSFATRARLLAQRLTSAGSSVPAPACEVRLQYAAPPSTSTGQDFERLPVSPVCLGLAVDLAAREWAKSGRSLNHSGPGFIARDTYGSCMASNWSLPGPPTNLTGFLGFVTQDTVEAARAWAEAAPQAALVPEELRIVIGLHLALESSLPFGEWRLPGQLHAAGVFGRLAEPSLASSWTHTDSSNGLRGVAAPTELVPGDGTRILGFPYDRSSLQTVPPGTVPAGPASPLAAHYSRTRPVHPARGAPGQASRVAPVVETRTTAVVQSTTEAYSATLSHAYASCSNRSFPELSAEQSFAQGVTGQAQIERERCRFALRFLGNGVIGASAAVNPLNGPPLHAQLVAEPVTPEDDLPDVIDCGLQTGSPFPTKPTPRNATNLMLVSFEGSLLNCPSGPVIEGPPAARFPPVLLPVNESTGLRLQLPEQLALDVAQLPQGVAAPDVLLVDADSVLNATSAALAKHSSELFAIKFRASSGVFVHWDQPIHDVLVSAAIADRDCFAVDELIDPAAPKLGPGFPDLGFECWFNLSALASDAAASIDSTALALENIRNGVTPRPSASVFAPWWTKFLPEFAVAEVRFATRHVGAVASNDGGQIFVLVTTPAPNETALSKYAPVPPQPQLLLDPTPGVEVVATPSLTLPEFLADMTIGGNKSLEVYQRQVPLLPASLANVERLVEIRTPAKFTHRQMSPDVLVRRVMSMQVGGVACKSFEARASGSYSSIPPYRNSELECVTTTRDLSAAAKSRVNSTAEVLARLRPYSPFNMTLSATDPWWRRFLPTYIAVAVDIRIRRLSGDFSGPPLWLVVAVEAPLPDEAALAPFEALASPSPSAAPSASPSVSPSTSPSASPSTPRSPADTSSASPSPSATATPTPALSGSPVPPPSAMVVAIDSLPSAGLSIEALRWPSLRSDVAVWDDSTAAPPASGISEKGSLWWPRLRGSRLGALLSAPPGSGPTAERGVRVFFGLRELACSCLADRVSADESTLACSVPMQVQKVLTCAWEALGASDRTLVSSGSSGAAPAGMHTRLNVSLQASGLAASATVPPAVPLQLSVPAAPMVAACLDAASEARDPSSWRTTGRSNASWPWCGCVSLPEAWAPARTSSCGNATSLRLTVPLVATHSGPSPQCPAAQASFAGRVLLAAPLPRLGTGALSVYALFLPPAVGVGVASQRRPLAKGTVVSGNALKARSAGAVSLRVRTMSAGPTFNESGVWSSGGGAPARVEASPADIWRSAEPMSQAAQAMALDDGITAWGITVRVGTVLGSTLGPAATTAAPTAVAAVHLDLSGHLGNIAGAAMMSGAVSSEAELWSPAVSLLSLTTTSQVANASASAALEPTSRFATVAGAAASGALLAPMTESRACGALPVVLGAVSSAQGGDSTGGTLSEDVDSSVRTATGQASQWVPTVAVDDTREGRGSAQGVVESAVVSARSSTEGQTVTFAVPGGALASVLPGTLLAAGGEIAAGASLPGAVVLVQLPVGPAVGEEAVVRCTSSDPSIVSVATALGTASGPGADASTTVVTRAWWLSTAGSLGLDSGGLALFSAVPEATRAASPPNVTVAVWGLDGVAGSPEGAVQVPVTCSITSRPAAGGEGTVGGAVFTSTAPVELPVLWAPTTLPALGEAVASFNASAAAALLQAAETDGTVSQQGSAARALASDVASLDGLSTWLRVSDRSAGVRGHYQAAILRSYAPSNVSADKSWLAFALLAAADSAAALAPELPASPPRQSLTQFEAQLSRGDAPSVAAGATALLGSPLILRASGSREVLLVCAGAAAVVSRGVDPTQVAAARCLGAGVRVFVGTAEAEVLEVVGSGVAARVMLPSLRCACAGGSAADASASATTNASLPPAGTALVQAPAFASVPGSSGSAANDAGCGSRPLVVVNPALMLPGDAEAGVVATGRSAGAGGCLSTPGSAATGAGAGAGAAPLIVTCDAAAMAASHAALAPQLVAGARLGGCVAGASGIGADAAARVTQLLQGSRRMRMEASADAGSASAVGLVASTASRRSTVTALSAAGLSFTAACVGYPAPGALCMDADAVRGGLVCAFGAGDECAACPRGAMCPGGFAALPLPGYWTDDASSSRAIVHCSTPSESRCQGWSQTKAAALCGEGFTGHACGTCSVGFRPDAVDGCVACPEGSPLELLLLPVAVYGGMAVGLVLLTVGGLRLLAIMTGATPTRVARSAAQFALWAVLLLQTISQVGRASQPGLAPELARLYGWLSVFELNPGLAVHPACIVGSPLFMESVVIGLVGCLSFLAVVAIVLVKRRTVLPALRRLPAPPSATSSAAAGRSSLVQQVPLREGTCGLVAKLSLTGTSVAFALAVNTALGLLNCVPGSRASGTEGQLVLGSNPFMVCWEGVHGMLAPAGGVVLGLATTAVALAAFDSCWRVESAAAASTDAGDVIYGAGCCCCRRRGAGTPPAKARSALQAPAAKSVTGGAGVVSGDAGGGAGSKLAASPGFSFVSPMQRTPRGKGEARGPSEAAAAATGASTPSTAAPEDAFKPTATLEAHVEAMSSLAPLLQAEYRPRDAPVMRLADLALIAVLGAVGTFLGPEAAAAHALASGGDAATAAEAAVADYGVAATCVIAAGCLSLVLLVRCGFAAGGPYIPEDAWKRPIRIGSLLLVVAASALNTLNAKAALAAAQADPSAAQLGAAVRVVSFAVLVLAVGTLLALLVGFWVSMLNLSWADADPAAKGAKRGRVPCLLACARRCGLRVERPPPEVLRRASVVRGASPRLAAAPAGAPLSPADDEAAGGSGASDGKLLAFRLDSDASPAVSNPLRGVTAMASSRDIKKLPKLKSTPAAPSDKLAGAALALSVAKRLRSRAAKKALLPEQLPAPDSPQSGPSSLLSSSRNLLSGSAVFRDGDARADRVGGGLVRAADRASGRV
ncbi:hypothetical protein FNF31_07574 [Cafeteria roenbergensis]|uniref:Uncharacterized protein n=1 Tax=Cafeteria roenbergensis TaxID=33653 RepID=A0A5A8C460_CAFRO|nr:hypothetical protein FNF31_07574 [Cafeteria roenbergensis]